jgi:NADH-quinone oxidoreductase subunit G
LPENDNSFFVEDSPFAPNSPYAASKAAAEHFVRAAYHTFKVDTVITRCVRFFTELRDSHPIGVESMGGKCTITLGPNGPIDDPYQMNIIDLCPVGALTSRDFRFKQRVWFMDFADTVCPGCARGCNITAGAFQNKLLRFVPRRKPEVNKSWLCDEGRVSYGD